MPAPDDSGPVTVFRTNDPGLLAVAQSLLAEADIEFFVAGEAMSGLYPGGAPIRSACQRFVWPPRTPTKHESCCGTCPDRGNSRRPSAYSRSVAAGLTWVIAFTGR